MKQYGDMILTTASSIEGYKIIAQCGLVFGETVFKHGFISRFGAGLSNAVDTLSWGSREMSGSMELIENAREFAYDKMIREAKNRGANAIIAIDSDNTFGGDIMYLSLYGTAVKAVSEDDYENQIRIEQEAREKKEVEDKRLELERKQRMDDIQKRKAAGEYSSEERFLKDIDSVDSVAQIWDYWLSAGLDRKYAEITRKIKIQKDSERMYGKMPGEASNLRNIIRASIFGE